MFKKSKMKNMIQKWEAFLAYGGERRILEALRAAPKGSNFHTFEWMVTSVFRECLPYAVQNESKIGDLIPLRNEREQGISDLRLLVLRKLDDTVWPYLWATMQSFKGPDMYQVYVDGRGFTTNYYSGSDEFQLLVSFMGFKNAIHNSQTPRLYNTNQCRIAREGPLRVATLSVGNIFNIPFYYTLPNIITASVKKWQPLNQPNAFELCIFDKKVRWGKGGSCTPAVAGFEAFYAESHQRWNARVHPEKLYDEILEQVPIPFAETLLSYQESELDDG